MFEKLQSWFITDRKPTPDNPEPPKDPRADIEIVPSAERVWHDGLTMDERLDVQIMENIRLNQEVRELRKLVAQLQMDSIAAVIEHQKALNERDTFERVAKAMREAFRDIL